MYCKSPMRYAEEETRNGSGTVKNTWFKQWSHREILNSSCHKMFNNQSYTEWKSILLKFSAFIR